MLDTTFARPRRALLPASFLLIALAACRDGHEPREDSVAIAAMVAEQAVPVITPGVTAELRLGARDTASAFDSTFRARMLPVIERLQGGVRQPPVVIEMRVDSLTIAGDSAVVVVHRRGTHRAEPARFSSNDTRYRFAWQRETGWALTQTEPFNFQGEGIPAARARDVWWQGKGADR
ncbi:MAG TPA: hypothetical protein VEA99_19330 [Gemmatimonadaceae bacterium]|nr:hypothetical protein [Gemmatimonadaceae bacterium]